LCLLKDSVEVIESEQTCVVEAGGSRFHSGATLHTARSAEGAVAVRQVSVSVESTSKTAKVPPPPVSRGTAGD
jgi:hypothetical protein